MPWVVRWREEMSNTITNKKQHRGHPSLTPCVVPKGGDCEPRIYVVPCSSACVINCSNRTGVPRRPSTWQIRAFGGLSNARLDVKRQDTLYIV